MRDVRTVPVEIGTSDELQRQLPTSEWQSIAMVSGCDDVRIAVEVIRLGAVIRLEKQFRMDELLATSAGR